MASHRGKSGYLFCYLELEVLDGWNMSYSCKFYEALSIFAANRSGIVEMVKEVLPEWVRLTGRSVERKYRK